jgi:hypothetical protein
MVLIQAPAISESAPLTMSRASFLTYPESSRTTNEAGD